LLDHVFQKATLALYGNRRSRCRSNAERRQRHENSLGGVVPLRLCGAGFNASVKNCLHVSVAQRWLLDAYE
jgi:hypothetical protein